MTVPILIHRLRWIFWIWAYIQGKNLGGASTTFGRKPNQGINVPYSSLFRLVSHMLPFNNNSSHLFRDKNLLITTPTGNISSIGQLTQPANHALATHPIVNSIKTGFDKTRVREEKQMCQWEDVLLKYRREMERSCLCQFGKEQANISWESP